METLRRRPVSSNSSTSFRAKRLTEKGEEYINARAWGDSRSQFRNTSFRSADLAFRKDCKMKSTGRKATFVIPDKAARYSSLIDSGVRRNSCQR